MSNKTTLCILILFQAFLSVGCGDKKIPNPDSKIEKNKREEEQKREQLKTQIIQEKLILIKFYETTNGINWTDSNGWKVYNNVCDWYGIECHIDGTVYKLNLPQNNLKGKINPELGNLKNLGKLDLSENNLTGQIPKELGNFTKLYALLLFSNKLMGVVPSEVIALENNNTVLNFIGNQSLKRP